MAIVRAELWASNVQRVAGVAGCRPGSMPFGQSGQGGPERVGSDDVAGVFGLVLVEETRLALQTRVFGCGVIGMEDFM